MPRATADAELLPRPPLQWASFLDSLTEELEETGVSTNPFDDHKFVTREQLHDWGLEHLIGSKLLRAYMVRPP